MMKSMKDMILMLLFNVSMKMGRMIRKKARGRCSNQGYQLFHPASVPVFSKIKSNMISFNKRLTARMKAKLILLMTL